MFQKRGEHATARPREMVEDMRRKGDTEGADTVAAHHRGDRHAGHAADPRIGQQLVDFSQRSAEIALSTGGARLAP